MLFKQIFFTVNILLFGFFISGCESKDEQKSIKKVVQKVDVDVYSIKEETYPIWIDFSGKTEAYKDVSVVSRVSGELQKIYFKAGDRVTKGQVLFKIDDSEYKAILDQKKATMAKNQASLELAQATFNRYEPLVAKDLVAREKLDELRANVKQYKAIVDADKAVVKQAKLNVKYTEVKASVDGLVAQEAISIGNLVTASSTSLTRIVNADRLYVNFSPSADEVSIIKKYRSEIKPAVVVKLNHKTDVKLKGKIDFIDSATNVTTGTVNMRAVLENEENIILPGSFVEIALFLTDKIPAIAVHPNTIGQNQLGTFVYFVNSENKIQTKQITLKYSNNDLAIVNSGLSAGDKVIVSDTTRLRNNILVNPKEVPNPINKRVE